VSDEDYRERLSNNSKELDAEVLKVGKAPRVRKDAMPQLSVSFMVGKLKEFAVASTHKELDRIQNEFTKQGGSTAVPHETQIAQGLQGEYDLPLLKAELWRVAGKTACRRALQSAMKPRCALSVNDPGHRGCPSLGLSGLLRLSRDPQNWRNEFYHAADRE